MAGLGSNLVETSCYESYNEGGGIEMTGRDWRSFNFVCTKCGATYGGRHGGKCPACGGVMKRDDLITDEDLEKIQRSER